MLSSGSRVACGDLLDYTELAELRALFHERSHAMMVEFVGFRGPACLLQASGRVNVLNADAFEARAMRAMAGTDCDVIIDASRLTYLSTSGLRVFLHVWQELQKRNRNLYICALQPYIRNVFELIGFDKLIPLQSDVDSALAASESGG